jgi:hypothetical protein
MWIDRLGARKGTIWLTAAGSSYRSVSTLRSGAVRSIISPIRLCSYLGGHGMRNCLIAAIFWGLLIGLLVAVVTGSGSPA